MTVRGWRPVAAVLAVVLLVAGCGRSTEVRDYVASTYEVVSRSGDNVEARTSQPVADVARDIADRFPTSERYDDPAGTFLRYDDEFVAVRPDPAATGGTLISVDDDETGSTRFVPIIGGIFLPGGRFGGSRGRSGGFGDSNRGGGPGAGK